MRSLAADFDAADDLVCWAKEQGACPPYTFAGLVKEIGELKKALAAARSDLEKIQPVRRTGAADALKHCLRTIDAWEGKRASPEEVAQALRRLCNRLSAAAAIVSRPA